MRTNTPKHIQRWSPLLAMCGLVFTGCNTGADQVELARVAPSEVGTARQSVVYGGHDYLFVFTPKTWQQAQTYCTNYGYSLATVNDASEEDFLNTQEVNRGWYNAWIGYNDIGIPGTWIWASGSSTYSHWAVGEPSAGNDHCALDRPLGYAWNNANCASAWPFICERTSPPTTHQGSFTYSAVNTANATVNTFNQSVHVYADMVLTVGTCGVPGAVASGDTVLHLFDPAGNEVVNDNSGGPCGTGSNMSVVTVEGTYVIHAGCHNNDSCHGTVAYTY